MLKIFRLFILLFLIISVSHLLLMNVYARNNSHGNLVKIQQKTNTCTVIKNKIIHPEQIDNNIIIVSQNLIKKDIGLAYKNAFKKAEKKLAQKTSQKKARAKLISFNIIKQRIMDLKEADAYAPIDANVIYAGNLSINVASGKKLRKTTRMATNKNFAFKKTALNLSPLIITLKNIFTLSKADTNQKQIIKKMKTESNSLVKKTSKAEIENLTLLDEGAIALLYANATQFFLEGNLEDALRETNNILTIDENSPEGLILLDKIEKNMH